MEPPGRYRSCRAAAPLEKTIDIDAPRGPDNIFPVARVN